MGRPRLPLLRWGARRARDPIGRRPEMRKNVTAITAHRAAMWNDHHQGDPDGLNHQPEGSPEYAE